ncbi:MAG TPA: IS66 family insertion sequence element accessory protein TnpB [Gammaproteobacteria bacterium]|nr:IS66 family insertion sequence element accessory protein TnpB [Gammaproteobacteria bacterium]
MTRTEREQGWQQHITAWQTSGLSAMAYCKQHSLIYSRFVYWRRKLAAPARVAEGSAPSGFARVTPVADAQATQGLSVLLPGGVSITGLHAGNIELLGAVLRQL